MALTRSHRLLQYARNPVVLLGVIAGILYSSWPLGYILNPIVAHTAFASQLEASHEPYDWLFISFDVLSGVILLVGGLIQWTKAKGLMIKLSIVGYVIFAVLVIVAALLPNECSSPTITCYRASHSSLSIIHGLASIVSVVALLASIVLILKALFRHSVSFWLKVILLSTIAGWSIVGLIALAAYHTADENIVQYAFITICSISLAVSVAAVEYLHYQLHDTT